MADKKTVTECAIAVAEALEMHKKVSEEKARIESRLCTATNDLNEATKAFDAAVQEFKSDAPWGTDWHRQLNPPHEIKAA